MATPTSELFRYIKEWAENQEAEMRRLETEFEYLKNREVSMEPGTITDIFEIYHNVRDLREDYNLGYGEDEKLRIIEEKATAIIRREVDGIYKNKHFK